MPLPSLCWYNMYIRANLLHKICLTMKYIHSGNFISDQRWYQYAAAAHAVPEHCGTRTSGTFAFQRKPRPTTVLRRKSLPTAAVHTGSCQNGICYPSHTAISNIVCPPNVWWKYVAHTSTGMCNPCSKCCTVCYVFLLVLYPILASHGGPATADPSPN